MLPVVFVEDVVFLCSLRWSGGVMAFTVGVRRLIVHGVAAGRGASYRCAAIGAGIGAGGWVGDRLGWRHVVGLLVTMVTLLLTAGVVAVRRTG